MTLAVNAANACAAAARLSDPLAIGGEAGDGAIICMVVVRVGRTGLRATNVIWFGRDEPVTYHARASVTVGYEGRVC